MGILKENGDPKTEKGPHGDPGRQMETHVASVDKHQYWELNFRETKFLL